MGERAYSPVENKSQVKRKKSTPYFFGGNWWRVQFYLFMKLQALVGVPAVPQEGPSLALLPGVCT